MDASHESRVEAQFGERAAAYLTSGVHARGEDLEALVSLVGERRHRRALDLGCGAGHASFAVAPFAAEVVALDLSPEMLDVVARTATERGLANVTTRKGTTDRLPFDDESFDCVISRYSAHHWPDLDRALREAVRVLAPGGLLAIVDSVSPGLPLLDTHLQAIELLRDTSHVRSYARAEWEAALARAGLIPGTLRAFKIRLEFDVWIARMRTPPVQAQAIRALQTSASKDVQRHFAIADDGGFDLDVALFQATKRGA